uniref:Uncharacterized protein n=1 Tax=Utricularia reniformis TaxID=192314 RepID=A0A1Y0B247_9LAMI|nr:hypothetical protein AEK19_MT1259 [Utricularia reniformis]ART31467.1 hypothetical protein AEK19_MT1259 [Utricularia reniformis]
MAFSTGTQSCFHRLSFIPSTLSLLRARHLRANSFQQHSIVLGLVYKSIHRGFRGTKKAHKTPASFLFPVRMID